MSGDVQPRKRKDKKRKKDDLGVEEPRGTAAVFGEGDVFMHSPHEHGTGGHWCAKVIFFSLLAILITLIGLIILENRGLTDLEANSVESQYSGILEGWLEEAPDDDHHDEHTLELKHHDVEGDENDHGDELAHDEDDQDDEDQNDDDHSDEYENDNEDEDDNGEQNQDDDDDNNDEDDDDDNNDEDDDDEHNLDEDEENEHEIDEDSEEQNNEANNEGEVEEHKYRRIFKRDVEANDDHDDDEDDDNYNQDDDNKDEDEQQFGDNYSEEDNDQISEENDYVINRDEDNDDEENEENNDNDDEDLHQSIENKDEDENENSKEFEQNDSEARDDEDEEEHDDEPEDVEIEVERIEKEVSEEDDASSEAPSYANFGEVDGKSQENEKDADADVDEDIVEEELLELEDDELPVVERIIVPAGKPLTEVEDKTSSESPPDTLAEEEEYEKQQEELRREQEQASHMWLKLAVGGALLLATHAVVRRATASRPGADTATSDDHASREETPSLIDRRMTLLMEEPPVPVVSKIVPRETPKPIEREVVKTPTVVKAPPPKQESEEEEEVEISIISKVKKNVEALKDKELYSDDDEDEEEEIAETKEEVSKKSEPVKEKESTPEPEEPEDDDVEIIDDEQLEEELEEEDVEEEISDVDDAELLSRLEAKYGRLPEPERPGRKHKDGGNSIEEEWPGEPSDPYWRDQLDRAEEDLRQGEWSSSLERVEGAVGAAGAALGGSARARWAVARALDAAADRRRDNKLLSRAIAAYLDLLKMNERLTDAQLRRVTERTIDRILFRGNYLGAEPIYRLLIRRFPDEPGYRNNLTVSFLMANRAELAEEVLKDTLKRWPNDRIALAHHGFVLKTQHNRLEEAVTAFQKALEGDTGPANEPRFYYHLGDALLLLGRFAEANEVHKRGTALGHFLSPAQRSLYNVKHLTGRPWWNIENTPYVKLIRALEKSWKEILKEGEAARSVYEKEKEGLKERGEWSQLDLFVRGREIPGRCDRAPVTCSIVRAEAAASGCRRGQIKFSSMEAGTHVRPHVGPTNCRLRMHLGLSNTKDTFIRVDKEIRQWKTGKVLIFDDSFEHEVWHNGTGTRLVLIVDVWHPDLTPAERRQLPAI